MPSHPPAPSTTAPVVVIGAGLAGSEAAWQLATAGVPVDLHEMKPERYSEAHCSPLFAELVCSNSLRGNDLSNAVGLLKEELRRGRSLVMQAAEACAVPAGGALAVDRERFAAKVTEALETHPLVTIHRGEVRELPSARPLVVATGPLTSEALAEAIVSRTDSDSLAFYDALAPIVDGESLDHDRLFAASRYDKGDGADYLNAAFDEEQYHAFIRALLEAEKTPLRDFEEPRFFPGCMPIEEIAAQSPLAPAHGPMKPVGLRDPRTGVQPFAVIQLRREDVPGTAYNLVGFQTRLTRPAQKAVFRTIPGLEAARFTRYGAVHRNTFLDAPRLLDERLALRDEPQLYFAGQITGVEGYVESLATGWLVGRMLAVEAGQGAWQPPPATTALGGLIHHVTHGAGGGYQPSNVRWDLMPPLDRKQRYRRRRERRLAMAQRALNDLDSWLDSLD